MLQGTLGMRQVAMAKVDHRQGVEGAQEARVLKHRRARPGIGFVELAARQRLHGAVVHVHRHDGGLTHIARAMASHLVGRQEIDGEQVAGVEAHAVRRPPAWPG